MNKFIQLQFLTFCPKILVNRQSLSLMNMAELMPIDGRSKPFSFFFALQILSASLCRDILMITFFGPALDFIQWQASIWSGWTSTSIFPNNFRTFSSRLLSVIDSGTPDISKPWRLEYCSFAQHWRSKNYNLSHNLVFTCFVIMTSDSSSS